MPSPRKPAPADATQATKLNPRAPARAPHPKQSAKPRNWSVRMLDLDYS